MIKKLPASLSFGFPQTLMVTWLPSEFEVQPSVLHQKRVHIVRGNHGFLLTSNSHGNHQTFVVTMYLESLRHEYFQNTVVSTLRISVIFQPTFDFSSKCQKVIKIIIFNHEKFSKNDQKSSFKSIAITKLRIHLFEFRVKVFKFVATLQTVYETI